MPTTTLYFGPTGTVTAAALASITAQLAQNGVVRGSGGGSALAVSPGSSGLTVNVANGSWFYNGYMGQLTNGPQTLTLASNSSGQTRIDRVVAQIDTTASPWAASIAVVQGTPGAGAPAINQNPNIWQLSLAQVSVPNGATTITTSNITDERGVVSVCGYATPQPHGADHLPNGRDPIPLGQLPPPDLAWAPLPGLAASGANQAISILPSTTGTYTVPTGQILAVTQAVLAQQYAYLAVGNATVAQNNWNQAAVLTFTCPVLVPAGTTVQAGGTNSSFQGILMPQGTLTPVVQSASGTTALTYTVPSSSWFVLLGVYVPQYASAARTFSVNGTNDALPGTSPTFAYLAYTGAVWYGANYIDSNGTLGYQLPRPLLFPPGTTLALNAVTSSPCALWGYLWPTTG